jgi:hypothetical protein
MGVIAAPAGSSLASAGAGPSPVRFALERDDLTVEHYVPAGVAVAA